MLDEDAGTGELPFSLAVIRVNRNDSEFEFKAVVEVLVFEALNGTLGQFGHVAAADVTFILHFEFEECSQPLIDVAEASLVALVPLLGFVEKECPRHLLEVLGSTVAVTFVTLLGFAARAFSQPLCEGIGAVTLFQQLVVAPGESLPGFLKYESPELLVDVSTGSAVAITP